MLAYFLDDFDPFIFRLWDNVGPRSSGSYGAGGLVTSFYRPSMLPACRLTAQHTSPIYIGWYGRKFTSQKPNKNRSAR